MYTYYVQTFFPLYVYFRFVGGSYQLKGNHWSTYSQAHSLRHRCASDDQTSHTTCANDKPYQTEPEQKRTGKEKNGVKITIQNQILNECRSGTDEKKNSYRIVVSQNLLQCTWHGWGGNGMRLMNVWTVYTNTQVSLCITFSPAKCSCPMIFFLHFSAPVPIRVFFFSFFRRCC